ncbi:MAG: acyl--CoA ligase, partial [Selenomonas sp.]|nr:acyl--CoA ligase [Selenomonas sp.]
MAEEKKLTGYPSIDKPWLKYYSEEAINMPLPECSLYDYLYDCNREHMEDYALNYFGKKITFKAFFHMIDRAAKAFLAIGVHEGETVPIVSVSTVASIVCFYALNRIGAVVDFLNVLAEKDDLVTYFKEANARVVVTLDLFEEKVLAAADECGVEKVVRFGVGYKMPIALRVGYHLKSKNKKPLYKGRSLVIDWSDFLARSKGMSAINYRKDPHKMCLLAHTGGTTGVPKAVMLDDCAMNAVVSQYISSSGIKRNDVFLSLIIPFVVYGILDNIHLPLCLGLQSVIIPKYDVKQWATYLIKYRPNHVLTVPAYISPLLEDERVAKMELSFFETAGVGGDGM